MAKSREQQRLERLLAKSEANVRGAFDQFVRQAKSDKVMAEVSDALERGDTQAALNIVNRYIVQFGAANAQNMVVMGALESHALDAALGVVGISFDPTHPRAAELIRNRTLELVTEMTSEQEAAIQQALSRAFISGAGIRDASRAFRDAIGLTSGQESAVENYRRLLATGNSESLDRALRDRRYDRTVARSVATDTPLSAPEINRMVDAYRRKTLKYRSEVIGRTESVRTLSEASLESARQAQEQAGIADSRIVRVWHSTKDKRTRDAHRAMDGQRRGVNEKFIDGDGYALMFPGDPQAPAKTSIQCRCVVVNVILAPGERREVTAQ